MAVDVGWAADPHDGGAGAVTPAGRLVEFDGLLSAAVLRVGRATANLVQESSGGFGSRTPGSGDPGGGKGGRASALLIDRDDVGDEGDRVPVSSVERVALGLAADDVAARRLAELGSVSVLLADRLGSVCVAAGVDPGPCPPVGASPLRWVVLGLARVQRLLRAPEDRLAELGEMVDGCRSMAGRVADIVQVWGYAPAVPQVRPAVRQVLAVDLTERWCTSHLRVGERRPRTRGVLCDWCDRQVRLARAQGVDSWEAPPVELVRKHVEHGKVYAQDIEPFLRAARDRQRNKRS